ncbi:MAG: rhomboid family intramembrane serine protease [Candidatus Latescibacteria bacterium]|nr:rhomboid family intramembrane serine protease [Candidatus Latescibacterota bacterium]
MDLPALETPAWTPLFRAPRFDPCAERALVLAALGIDYILLREGESYTLLVEASAARRAADELGAYDRENLGWPPPEEILPAEVPGKLHSLVGYAGILCSAFYLERTRTYALDWWQAGRGDAGLILQGQWWRALTALTLHADEAHLLSNLLFGAFFAFLLCRQLGAGAAWFAILLAGTAGNLLNAELHPSDHRFIGASTAVFGAIGILSALQWKPRPSRWRQWAPLVIGALLLGFLGTAGKHTDVLAHITGMAAGLLSGLVWRWLPTPLPPSVQTALGAATLLSLVLTWAWALAQAAGR